MTLPAATSAALVVALVARGARARVTTRRARTRITPVSAHHRRAVFRAHTRPPGTEQWATFLDTIAAEVRTGSSLTVAQQHASARHPQCRWTEDLQHADAALVAVTLRSVRSLGGPVAATLDSAAAVLRERVAARADVAVHSAQARLSARVLTAVPVVFCCWNTLSSSSFRRAVCSPTGVVCVASGALCNLIGWWWMRRCIDRVLR